MQRVLVLGSSGSGKSTFVDRLASVTNLPKVSMDAIYWQPGWQPSDNASFGLRMKEIALGERWIMDGNYIAHGAGELRRSRADMIFWFDLPRYVCMASVLYRVAKSYGRVRLEMAAGCPERIDLEFFDYVWTYRSKQRPKLISYFEGLRPDQKLIMFSRRAEANAYFDTFPVAASLN